MASASGLRQAAAAVDNHYFSNRMRDEKPGAQPITLPTTRCFNRQGRK